MPTNFLKYENHIPYYQFLTHENDKIRTQKILHDNIFV